MTETDRNKELIRNFYQEFFNDHQLDSADRYVREDYIQHNPEVGQGREGLKEYFRKTFAADPGFHLVIKKMIAEGDLVAVHLKKTDSEGRAAAQVADFYRLADGKLAEHWDVLMPC